MKKRKWFLTFMLVAILAVGLAACGGDSGDVAPTGESTTAAQTQPTATTLAPPTTAPTETPEPAPEPTDTAVPEAPPEDEELDLGSVGLPEQLASYRSRMRLATYGTGTEGETSSVVEISVEYTQEPLAQHIIITGEGSDQVGEAEGMEMYRVEDTAYIKLGDQWISTPATDDVLDQSGMIDPEDMLGGTCGWHREGRTDYSGVPTVHWTLSEADLKACMTPAALTGFGNITTGSGELYVAEEGSYIAYMELVFEGTDLQVALGGEEEAVKEGRLEFTYEMTDVNEPITIELPEEAVASSSLPEDIPVPDDAEEVSFMFGMMTFNSPSSASEVADYYKAQMPQNGWSESSTSELSGMYMLDYTKGGRTASFIISTDSDTQMTSVLITIQEE